MTITRAREQMDAIQIGAHARFAGDETPRTLLSRDPVELSAYHDGQLTVTRAWVARWRVMRHVQLKDRVRWDEGRIWTPGVETRYPDGTSRLVVGDDAPTEEDARAQFAGLGAILA